MARQYDTNFAMEPPADLPLSTKVKGLRKKYEDAGKAYEKYVQENSRYCTINVAPEWSTIRQDGSIALEDAKRELRHLEIAAVDAGKPLPDKEKALGPVKAKMDEYNRMVSTLKALVQKAKQEYSDAVFDDLQTMGLKEAEKAYKARLEWEKAYRAAMDARATLERHTSLFTWCVSAGGWDTYPTQGNSLGENLEAWALTEDGRLTYEASVEMEFQNSAAYQHSLIEIEGLIEPDPNPPVIEEHNGNPTPRIWNAKESPVFDVDARSYFA
ncbi:hypothetical protein ACFYM5_18930 [Streptomyces sp. NPDC006706]|uniref:hypothetical protein n=1 Tax=Streptomyces sp. NPDC006706 TaxID=3364761 RepID=UPI00369EED57